MFGPAAYADQFDDQISQLNAQIAQNQAAANSLQGQANTLSNAVSALDAQVAAVRAQLELNQEQQAQTSAQIAAAQQQLATKKSILNENIRNIYQQSQVTPLEMLASSKNFSDYVDRQQYLDQIKDHIQDEMSQVQQLQTSLESRQTNLNLLVTQQSSLASSLQAQENQQAALLNQTQGQEAGYQQLVSANKSKLSAIVSARAAAVRSGNLKVSGGGCGPYPDSWCRASQDSLVTDGGYYNRECTSYAAYRRETTGHSLPNRYGNADQWAAYVNSHSPSAGDIAVWGDYANAYIGGVGHVAYVESVDGGGITISQYNFDTGSGPGQYSTMYIPYGSTMWGGIGFIQ